MVQPSLTRATAGGLLGAMSNPVSHFERSGGAQRAATRPSMSRRTSAAPFSRSIKEWCWMTSLRSSETVEILRGTMREHGAGAPIVEALYRLLKGTPALRGVFPAQEQLMQDSCASLRRAEAMGWQHLVARKIEDIRRIDATGIERVLAIVACSRSGADLLYSYFDGHDDVLMIPPLGGDRIRLGEIP
jgi:hypothetical protein